MKRSIAGLAIAIVLACPLAASAQYGIAVRSVRVGAADVAKTAAFYQTVLGLKEVSRSQRPDFLEIIMNFGATAEQAKASTGVKVVVISRPASAAPDTVSHLIFHCPDVVAAVSRVTSSGGTIERAPSKSAPSGSTVAMVLDPSGNRIELIQPAAQ
jgi:predicted enzyme related to lactoylglutathione lyase